MSTKNTPEHWEAGAPLWQYAANGENGFSGLSFGTVDEFTDILREMIDEEEDYETRDSLVSIFAHWFGRHIGEDEFLYGETVQSMEVLPRVAKDSGYIY